MNIQEYFKQFYNMKPWLYISESQWLHIKEIYPKDDVKQELAKCAMTYPLPLVNITEKDAYNEFQRLKSVRWRDIFKEGEWFPRKADNLRYSTKYNDSHFYFSRYNGGNKSSDYFHQYNRWTVSGSQGPGPVRTWFNEKFMTSLMGALYSLKMEKVDAGTLRTCLSLRKYTCSQFKPAISKSLYEMFNAQTVLDFSMGWGDRLVSAFASSCTKHYVGIDPRIENHPIYQKQIEFYNKHTGFFEEPTKCDLHISPAEDFDFSPYNDYFDLIFTSPPYFNVEKYSEDDTQSWVRYKNIDKWNKEFLHKSLGNMIPTLKTGGIMAINISDVYATSGKERKYLSIVNPMCDFLVEHGMLYKGAIGMAMAARPNSGGAGMARENELNNWSDTSLENVIATKDLTFAEPIFVFEKK